jgi:cell wall-associated NlpC family hydrolase
MGTTYQVDSDVGVNVRDAPDGNRVDGLPNGTVVVATGDAPVSAGDHTWLKVSAQGSGIVGWIATDFLTEVPDPVQPTGVSTDDGDARQRVLVAAEARKGTPYRMPPDGVTNLDCSLFILKTFRDAGIPFSDSVRTAQQIRLACNPIADADVQPGDMVFFQNTYAAGDGVASHAGISLGAGTGQMWDCHAFPGESGPPGVGLTNIRTDYWQQHWLDTRRPPQLG